MAGKLNGAIPAQTPRGCLRLYVSTLVERFSDVSPIVKVGMLQQCSTTSRPRKTSPAASARVFPCSVVMLAARSSMLSRIRAWNLSITRALLGTETSFHVENASFAAAVAASISS